jgi:hypothetical protein
MREVFPQIGGPAVFVEERRPDGPGGLGERHGFVKSGFLECWGRNDGCGCTCCGGGGGGETHPGAIVHCPCGCLDCNCQREYGGSLYAEFMTGRMPELLYLNRIDENGTEYWNFPLERPGLLSTGWVLMASRSRGWGVGGNLYRI